MTPLRIGLTGGIGTGKSTVAHVFAEFGVPMIDADDVSRALMQPGQAGFTKTVAAFGNGILQNGRIDRRRLRRRIFSESAERRKLEGILHPLVYDELDRWARNLNAPYCLLCIPLLIETAPPGFVDRVLVVDCSPERQVQRVSKRDDISAEEVASIVKVQMSRDQRLRSADDVITNDEAADRLHAQVEALHARYLALAQQAGKARAANSSDRALT